MGHTGEHKRARSPRSRERWERSDVTFLKRAAGRGRERERERERERGRQAGVREQLLMYIGRAGPVSSSQGHTVFPSFMHPPARLSSTTARCFLTGSVANLFLAQKAVVCQFLFPPATPSTEPGKCVSSHFISC